jgi:hypothetical protein
MKLECPGADPEVNKVTKHPDTRLLDHLLTEEMVWTDDGEIIEDRDALERHLSPVCETCDGEGGHYAQHMSDPLARMPDPQAWVECPKCNGKGYTPHGI